MDSSSSDAPRRHVAPSRDMADLIDIMAQLRTPVTGCPWDLQQDFRSIAPYTIEEAYEVADAIVREDMDDLRDELGDLLLQVVYHARLAQERDAFSFDDVVEAITRKMIRRHPHVFADANGNVSPAGVKSAWERIKAEEKTERSHARSGAPEVGLLSQIKGGQPALFHAIALQKTASTIGFDWNNPRSVLGKIREEADEIEIALGQNDDCAAAEEIGDLMFAVVNLARHVKCDPEMVLRGANLKFERRFGHIERSLAVSGRTLESATLHEMEALWAEAKTLENGTPKSD